jgi:hypothetical protein
MSVLYKDIIVNGSAVMPDGDVTTQIGGAAAPTKKACFKDIGANSQVEAVSENAGDTTQTLTVYGRIVSGAKDNEAISLNGTTPAQAGAPITWERLLKATLSAAGAGHIALMSTTNERSNTAQAGGVDAAGNPYIQLDVGASGVDGAYRHMVIRIASGTGANQIREIIKYTGSTFYAYVNSSWDTAPDATSVFEIATGFVFDDEPTGITECRRVHYDASANPSGGADKFYYEKIFIRNKNATDALTNALLKEIAGGLASIMEFDLESTLGGSDDNGVGNNRQVAPGGYTFDSADKDIGDAGDGNFDAASSQGVWLKLTLANGASANNDEYTLETEGQTT